MVNFPTICVDNFYNDPDKVRNFALELEYYPSNGQYPGTRTKLLHEIDENLFQIFCGKLLSLYYPNDDSLRCNITTGFWKVGAQDPNPLSPKNIGWIHQDVCLFAGVIYLTPNIDRSLGTSIYILKENYDHNISKEKNFISKNKFYAKGIDDNFDQAILENNSRFEETTKFYNVYNRMVSFDSQSFHSPSNYYTKDETRLAQVFFVGELSSDDSYPLTRINNIGI